MLSHLPRRDLCHSKSLIFWTRFCKLSKKYIFTLKFSTGPKRTIRYWTGPSQEAILRRRHNRVTEKTQSVTGWGEIKRNYLLQLTSQKIVSLSFPRFSLTCILYSVFCYSGCTIRYFTCGSRKDHVLSRSRERPRPWRERKGFTKSHGGGPPPQSTHSWGLHGGGERWLTSAFFSKFLKY